MKYLFLLVLGLFLVGPSFAQVGYTGYVNPTKKQTVKVYENKNGIQSLTPSKVVETKGNTTKVYKTNNGVKQLTPSTVMERRGNTVREYKTNNGVRQLTPTRTYRVQEK
jgi:hypothetical protein